MKQIVKITFLLLLIRPTFGQDSGIIWIDSFLPGSSDVQDSTVDKAALSSLDSLMQDPGIEVTFLGAADSIGWLIHGKHVHDYVSDALNDAKRLGRARKLRERYGRGHIGVTDENVAGVKVIWTKKSELLTAASASAVANNGINGSNGHAGNLSAVAMEGVKGAMESLSEPKTNGHTELVLKEEPTFDWRLQAGVWLWNGGPHGSIMAPALASSVVIGKTAFLLQGGVTPWHRARSYGSEGESFLYVGVKYMQTDFYGFSAGGFRGWRFLTDTDNWSLKTTGGALGLVLSNSIVEFTPTLTYSHISTLTNGSQWRFGSMLNLNFKIY